MLVFVVIGLFLGKSISLAPIPPENNLSVPKPIIFVLGGDVMLGRMVSWKLKQAGDYSSLFSNLKNTWADADMVMMNLESPLYSNCEVKNSTSMRFCAEPVFAKVLADADITHVSFANNHILDYGGVGVEETNSLLSENGITVANHATPVLSEVDNKKIGFVSWNLTWNNVADKEIRLKINALRNKADLAVVNFHWGEEYTDEPNEYQKQIAHLAVDSGADIVIGHHPHHLQPVEEYKGKLIFYSLGNLIFDQLWSEKTRYGMLVRVEWNPQQNTMFYTTSTTYMKDWAEAALVNQP